MGWREAVWGWCLACCAARSVRLLEGLEGLPATLTPLRLLPSPEGPILTFCTAIPLTGPPELAPFFDGLRDASPCPSPPLAVRLNEALDLLASEGPTPPPSSLIDGFVIHAMRVGSTAVSNLLGSHPSCVVLKEPEVWADLLDLHGISSRDAPVPSLHPLRGEGWGRVEESLRGVAQLFRRSVEEQMRREARGRGGWREGMQGSRLKIVVKLSTAGKQTGLFPVVERGSCSLPSPHLTM